MSTLLDEGVPPVRRKVILFMLVDKSGSMEGCKIGAVNDAMENVIPIVKEISDENADFEIEMAVLEFSNSAEWTFDHPKPIDGFMWKKISAEGMTAFGAACTELLSKLSKQEGGFMGSKIGYGAPAIVLLSDGGPTDSYREALDRLKENQWFKHSIKIAIAIGDDANKKVLCEFTGSSEAVITVKKLESLKQMIHLVVLSSTKVASKTGTVGKLTKQEEVESVVRNEIKSIDGIDLSTSIVDTDADGNWD